VFATQYRTSGVYGGTIVAERHLCVHVPREPWRLPYPGPLTASNPLALRSVSRISSSTPTASAYRSRVEILLSRSPASRRATTG